MWRKTKDELIKEKEDEGKELMQCFTKETTSYQWCGPGTVIDHNGKQFLVKLSDQCLDHFVVVLMPIDLYVLVYKQIYASLKIAFPVLFSFQFC